LTIIGRFSGEGNELILFKINKAKLINISVQEAILC